MPKNDSKKQNYFIIIPALLGVLAVLVVAIIFLVPDDIDFRAPGIAVIPIKGEISNSSSGVGSPSATEIAGFIEDAENNPAVGAIFLDIDSPGGEVVASKQIVYQVRKASKPVYAYINSVGASGAYYIASASDYVMADEDSITGSIGAISIFFNFEELLEKIGVKANVIKQGDLKAIGSPFSELTDEEREILQTILKDVHEGFKQDVLEFRAGKISGAELERIADGRILSGRQALQSNLVDGLMTRDEALDRTAELSGIKEPVWISYEKQGFSFFDLIFSMGTAFGQGVSSSLSAGNALAIK